jgi:hypothetical protein
MELLRSTDGSLPRAREEELLVHELLDEVLVYDLNRHRAHSLNRTAALIWRHCDGKTTTAEMAALVQRELNLPVDEDLVWQALRRLGRANLLQERFALPAHAGHCSRREVMRKLGMAGGLAIVTSILVPTAAQAGNTIRTNVCHDQPTSNCGGAPCDTSPVTHCLPNDACQPGHSGNCQCTCR